MSAYTAEERNLIDSEAKRNYLERCRIGHLGSCEEDRKNLQDCDWIKAELDLKNSGKVRMLGSKYET